jgi:hypothetical protein
LAAVVGCYKEEESCCVLNQQHVRQAGTVLTQAAVGDDKVDLLWLDAGLLQRLPDGGKAGLPILIPSCFYATVPAVCCLYCWGNCCLVSQAGAVGHPVLELDALLIEGAAGLDD